MPIELPETEVPLFKTHAPSLWRPEWNPVPHAKGPAPKHLVRTCLCPNCRDKRDARAANRRRGDRA